METPPTSPHSRDTFNKILAQLDDPNEAIQHIALDRCNKWLQHNNLRWTDIIPYSPKQYHTPSPTPIQQHSPSTKKDAWFIIIGICIIVCILTIIYFFP